MYENMAQPFYRFPIHFMMPCHIFTGQFIGTFPDTLQIINNRMTEQFVRDK